MNFSEDNYEDFTQIDKSAKSTQMIRNTTEIVENFKNVCSGNRYNMLRCFWIYCGVKIEPDKKSMEVLEEYNTKYKIKEIEKKYKLHCYYEEKAKKQAEEEAKEAIIQAELEKEREKEREKEKPKEATAEKKKGSGKIPKVVNKKNMPVASNKVDYKLMFEKYYKMKDVVLKDYLDYLKALDSQSAISVLRTRKATPLGYVNLMRDLCGQIEVDTELVEGFYKMFGETPTKFRLYDFTEHKWLSVRWNGKLMMMDVFYGAYKVSKSKFEYCPNDFCFMREQDQFLYDYFPKDWKYTGTFKLNIMSWEHKIKVAREFWQYGLNLTRDNDYAVLMNEEGYWDVNYDVLPGVEITTKLCYASNNEKVEDGFLYLRNYGTYFNLKINFPKKTHYTLEIFGKRANEPKTKLPNSLVKYRLVALKAKGPKAKFPIKVQESSVDLISPLTFNLNKVKTDFEVLAEHACEIAMINSDKQMLEFEKVDNGYWRCSTPPLLKGDVTIKVKNDDGKWLEGFKFLVK